ncbi:energy transducer TonB family protein [Antarcticimicrobium sediminis]|uniref:TonB family protein n=1 Tax=Antarcticimicrobium sediminis TaxID=2546227 RepID=A0A4R5ETS5_9RHOB|nr:energy transducer TonB [Antarcticimicrobium sediminis]TDE38291.1 TonB family protein [Antarcticimicrobium sediminis]
MTGALAEKVAFGLIAAGLHVLAFAALPGTGAQTQGAGGDGRITLQGATPQIEAMVAAWTAPPETAQPVTLEQPIPPAMETAEPDLAQATPEPIPTRPVPTQPERPTAPSAPDAAQLPLPRPIPTPPMADALALPAPQPDPATMDRPEIAAPSPVLSSRQRSAPTPEAPPAPVTPRAPDLAEARQLPPPPPAPPKPREIAPPKPAQQASAAVQSQQAAGRGGGAQAGNGNRSDRAALSPGQRNSLIAAWGAQITNRIERTKRAPRGLRKGGRVVLRLQVSRAGQLQSVSVRQSSGNAELDAAAIRAVRRAKRFPAAPEGLNKPFYSFSLPVRFND